VCVCVCVRVVSVLCLRRCAVSLSLDVAPMVRAPLLNHAQKVRRSFNELGVRYIFLVQNRELPGESGTCLSPQKTFRPTVQTLPSALNTPGRGRFRAPPERARTGTAALGIPASPRPGPARWARPQRSRRRRRILRLSSTWGPSRRRLRFAW